MEQAVARKTAGLNSRKPAVLEALRTQIARAEAGGPDHTPIGIPAFSFGEASVDAHLPSQGLERAALHEVMAAEHCDRPAAQGFLMALLARLWADLGPYDRRPVLWCQQEDALSDFGSLYGPGLAAFGVDPDRLVLVRARAVADVLWAMEEGVKCSALSAVVGTFGRGSSCLDLTASRRLQLVAEASSVTAFFLRLPSDAPVSVARSRWRVSTAPSAGPQWLNGALSIPRNHGIGLPRWHVGLEKCRGGGPATWELEWEYAAHRFRLAAPLADRPVLPDVGMGDGQVGDIIAFEHARFISAQVA